MKRVLLMLGVGLMLVAGCAKEDSRVASLEGQLRKLEAEKEQADSRAEELQGQLADRDTRLSTAASEADALRLQLERAQAAGDNGETGKLKLRIDELEAEVARLKAAPPAEVVKPEEAKPGPEPAKRETIPADEARKRFDELLPDVKRGDDAALGALTDLMYGADKETRDQFIETVRQWVKEEPDNKLAHLTLAAVLTSRFQDLTNPMKMGALAGEIKDATNAALKIDPEYYDAVHFLAILKVNYPTFTPEFKDAPTTLDKAISMQAEMTWEDRFGEIYVGYSQWHRKQNQLDKATERVQQGLDKAPRYQPLLDEQQAIEAAKANPEE